jgi:hypothetical protein
MRCKPLTSVNDLRGYLAPKHDLSRNNHTHRADSIVCGMHLYLVQSLVTKSACRYNVGSRDHRVVENTS